MTSPLSTPVYIVEVDDRCARQLVGHTGCSYASPPQPAAQALALVRALLGCPRIPSAFTTAPGATPLPAAPGTTRLHAAHADGQLHL